MIVYETSAINVTMLECEWHLQQKLMTKSKITRVSYQNVIAKNAQNLAARP